MDPKIEAEFTAPPLQVTETKTLIMEYVELPIADLMFRFLYRFKEPIPTVWSKGAVSYVMLPDALNNLKNSLKEYGLQKYYKMVTKGMKGPFPSEGQFLMEVDLCTIVECEIVPKS